MNIFTATSLSKAFDERVLFDDLSVSISRNQKSAIVAANGSGKSTLLRILSGMERPDTGSVAMRKGTRTGYLEQEPGFESESSVQKAVFPADQEVFRLIAEYEMLASVPNADAGQMQRITGRMDELGAWNIEHKAREVLGKLGIHDFSRIMGSLSGGERKRVALARLLITEPDLLLLDEPTNHLDLEMIEWLEKYLSALNKSILLVTHDRYFLDNVCDTILELSGGNLYTYKGNYSYFLEKKLERETAEASSARKHLNHYRKELVWMRRQPQARGTKQKARVDAFERTEDTVQGKKTEGKLNIEMQMERIGRKVLELEYVCKAYGPKTLLHNFTHTFKRGEKAGVIGRNGSGKTTLLKMIMGMERPDKGRIRRGETIRFGYYSQEGLPAHGDKTVIEVAREIADYVETGTGKGKWTPVGRFLEQFGFPPARQRTPVSKLSGGERRRLYLLTVLIDKPNFLVLDEPTNDLDIDTLNTLEDFLAGYGGCMLLVSHDRYFMDRLVDNVFVLQGDGSVRIIHGNYTDYRFEPLPARNPSSGPEPSVRKKPKSKRRGLSYREKQELESLESSLARLEARKTELLELMNDPGKAHEEVRHASEAYARVEQQLQDGMERWVELSEKK